MSISKTDKLLKNTILIKSDLNLIERSVKIAILNALSYKLISPGRLLEQNLYIGDGFLDIASFLKDGDTVGMIGCLGNYSCWEIGKIRTLNKIFFSDFEYVEPFKGGVEVFINRVFRFPSKVILSNGRNNRAICECSDVMIITSDTLYTNTFDELLKWSKNAREILIVGRSYAMDPLPIFARGVTGLTTQEIVHPNITDFVKGKLCSKEFWFTDSLVKCFKRKYIIKFKNEDIQSMNQEKEIKLGRQSKFHLGKERVSDMKPIGDRVVEVSEVTILDKTLQYLEENSNATERKISTIHLSNYFTVVELDDGSVGAYMSYYRFPLPVLANIQSRITNILIEDPLLLGILFQQKRGHQLELLQEQECLFMKSLQTTVISALSARFLRDRGDATFQVSNSLPFDPFTGVQRAMVIGFGGYMDNMVRADHIMELHIADLFYNMRQTEMEMTITRYRQQYPWKTITISDGHDTARRLREVDVVSITGSALCNGSMDWLLHEASGGLRIIVQGQSASIHPKILFEKGVHLIATTLKPRILVTLAKADPNGSAMQQILEGGLPMIYLVPRK
jgi:uncharacterized protein (DUF4213/DUF364 family)